MGIGKLYYFAASFMLASYALTSHWGFFDGAFHRPKNQAKKKAKKAEEKATKKAEELADELEGEGRGSKDTHKKRRRRDDTPAPRAAHPAAGAKRDRRRPRAHDDVERHGDVRYRDERYSDGSSRSSSYTASRQHRSNPPSRRHSYHRDVEHRVKPTPYSDYVPEASVRLGNL